MISRELYNEKMTKAILFTGQNLKSQAVDVIYDEIKANYTNKDFEAAIEDVMESEGLRLNGVSLTKRLNYHRSWRFEKEAIEAKRREEENTSKFWNQEFRMGCINHKCYFCDRIRCDDIAKATIVYMKDVLSFEPDIGLSPADQVKQKQAYRAKKRQQLMIDFPGAGFENEYRPNKDITLDELQGRVKPKLAVIKDREDDQSRWESEFYGEEFVKEDL